MSRRFTIKIGTKNNAKYEIYIDDNESYNAFIDKLSQEHPIDDTSYFKFICKGRIIDQNNFDTLDSGSVLLTLICNKIPLITAPLQTSSTPIVHLPTCQCTCNQPQPKFQPESQSQSQSQSQPQSQAPLSSVTTPSPVTSIEPTYTYNEVKATIITFLSIIKLNSQVYQMYVNDLPQLTNELIHNPALQTIIQDILGQSKQIANAMLTGQQISVKINDTNTNDKEIVMTPEDGVIIDELVNMGFDPNRALVMYLKNNKNKAATIEALLSS